jgi:hypothetical protein
MPYNCNICNKEFISNSGFWKHNKKYHQSILINVSKIMSNNCQNLSNICQNSSNNCQNMLNNKFKCDYCNKICNSRQSKWYHIKKCKKEYDEKQNKLIELENKNKLENDKLKNEIEQLKHLLHKTLKVKPNLLNKINNSKIINSNNTINNNNNTINIVKFGTEDLQNIFTEKQMFNLINKGGLCINESIKYIHFNDKKPEYKNIFITNLKDKYAYVFDGDTFIIKEKNEVLDELLDNHAYNIKEFVEKNRDDLADHTKRSMDRLLNFIYNKNENEEYVNFDKYKLNNIKLLVYNLSNKNTNLINITCN